MAASATSRSWNEALDNLGENLVRLGSSLRAHEDKPGGLSSDEEIVTTLGPLAAKFAAAFRQAQPILEYTERFFLRLEPSGPGTKPPTADTETLLRDADTLVHEAILSAREIVSFLDRLVEVSRVDAGRTRRILQPILHQFSDSVVNVGWELRTVCHEFSSEVNLTGSPPAHLEELGVGATVLTRDMVSTARQLRSSRKLWFRTEQRLAAIPVSVPAGGRAGSREHEGR